MNPLLCQLSYAAAFTPKDIALLRRLASRGLTCLFVVRDFGELDRAASCVPLISRSPYYCAITRLIVKIGNSSASATPPMINPITQIIAGSMYFVRLAICSFSSSSA